MVLHTGSLEQRGDVYHGAWVPVRLRSRARFDVQTGLIDIGADQTMVPRRVITSLGFQRVGDVLVKGVTSEKKDDTYRVDSMEIAGYTVVNIEVVPYDGDFVLVGRDILNDLVLHYDGPALTFTLTDPLTTSP